MRPSVCLSSQSINIAPAATAMERRERGSRGNASVRKERQPSHFPKEAFFFFFRLLVARGAPGIDSGGTSQAGGEEKTTGSQGEGGFEVAPFLPNLSENLAFIFFIPFCFLPFFAASSLWKCLVWFSEKGEENYLLKSDPLSLIEI